jgi:toxin ParE1/3/4
MSNRKTHFELALPADADLEVIFSYTDEEYGLDQAIKYVTELEDVFEQLVENPELGRERNEIKKDLRSFPKGEHVVFYRILTKHIRIVRVLHGSRDLPKQF